MKEEGQRLFGGAAATRKDTPRGAPDDPTTANTSRAAKSDKPKPKSKAGATADAVPDADAWAIILEAVTGPDHQRAAAIRRADLARELDRPDLAIRNRADGSAIVMGAYPSATDTRAQADLEWVRAIPRGKTRPFAKAYLVPPAAETITAGEADSAWNLAGIRDTRGGADKELTLQIAVFDGAGSIARARADAEAFAVSLRAGGEQAFYFHGPGLSVVTIGLFDEREADNAGNPASRAAQEAKTAHPLNLRNGRDPILDLAGNPQPSALMRIP